MAARPSDWCWYVHTYCKKNCYFIDGLQNRARSLSACAKLSRWTDWWLISAYDTDNHLIFFFLLLLQRFYLLSTLQSSTFFANNCQCGRALKYLGLPRNRLALMKEESDQRNISGFESGTTKKKNPLLCNNAVQIYEQWRLHSCCEVKPQTLQSELRVQALRRWERSKSDITTLLFVALQQGNVQTQRKGWMLWHKRQIYQYWFWLPVWREAWPNQKV